MYPGIQLTIKQNWFILNGLTPKQMEYIGAHSVLKHQAISVHSAD